MRHRLIPAGRTGLFALMQDDHERITTSWRTEDLTFQLEDAESRLDPRLLPDLARRLAGFFAGDIVSFSDVALPPGGAFFRECWDVCRRIPRGRTLSYGELAERAGSPAASRAAGQAMRRNPLPVIIPCHRVVASSGALHGFGGSCDAAGQSVGIKRILLEMEAAAAEKRRTRAAVVA